MRVLAGLLGLLALAALAQGKRAKTSEERLSKLRELEAAGGGIAALERSAYSKNVLKQPRDFDTLVLFTAGPRYNCHVCPAVEEEYQALVYSYSLLSEADRKGKELVFAQANYGKAQEAFAEHNFRHLPVLLFVPAADEGDKDMGGAVEKDRMVLGEMEAPEMARLLRIKTGVAVPIEYPVTAGALFNNLLQIAALLSAGFLGVRHYEGLLRRLRNRNLWRLISFGIYGVSISGVVFDIIRSPPAFYAGQNGFMFFHPQSGQQFVVEGLIIGGLNLACAVAAIVAYKYAPYVSQQNRMTWVVGCCFFFTMFFSSIRYQYVKKNRWYRG